MAYVERVWRCIGIAVCAMVSVDALGEFAMAARSAHIAQTAREGWAGLTPSLARGETRTPGVIGPVVALCSRGGRGRWSFWRLASYASRARWV